MSGLACRIMKYAEKSPEAMPLCPATLPCLGNPDEVGQQLQYLAQSGSLMRICQGVYMRPVKTRFGQCAPQVGKALKALAALWGETIVPCGGAAANHLRLTRQNPVREVYLTSGPSRRLHFGSFVVELRNALSWQLVAPHRKAGDIIRALEWLGPEEVEDSLEAVLPTLSEADREELAAIRVTTMPRWMAEPISARLAHG